MRYRSKKDPSIIASFVSENEKFKTTMLCYETGEKAGTAFSVSNSTLKRWWARVDSEEVQPEIDESFGIDNEQINKPYAPDVTPHYIPKPESVKEYEENKKVRRGYNADIPEFEDLTELLTDAGIVIKVNDNSRYVKLADKATTVWRKSKGLFIYAATEIGEALAKAGYKSSPNKDKIRPFAFEINTKEDLDTVIDVIKNTLVKE